MATAAEVIASWPEESQEAAQLVIDAHGEPHEITETQLTWHRVGRLGRGSRSKNRKKPS
jgi:hypothetical protein